MAITAFSKMTTPADRKLELEKKKARLAAIKEEKRKREEERRALSGQVAGASPAGMKFFC